jgi:hypothetical protein
VPERLRLRARRLGRLLPAFLDLVQVVGDFRLSGNLFRFVERGSP